MPPASLAPVQSQHSDVCDTVPFTLETQIVMDNVLPDECFWIDACTGPKPPSPKPATPEPVTDVKRQLFSEGPESCKGEAVACTEPLASGLSLETSQDLSSKLLHQPAPQKKHCTGN